MKLLKTMKSQTLFDEKKQKFHILLLFVMDTHIKRRGGTIS